METSRISEVKAPQHFKTRRSRLDEDGFDLVGRRKPFELAVTDGPHERRLAAVVAAEQPVLVAALQLHLRVVEQDLRACAGTTPSRHVGSRVIMTAATSSSSSFFTPSH